MLEALQTPHRRLNLLTNEWVLVSPQRTARPWQGQVETVSRNVGVDYDPKCYLCPGNERARGVRNPQYETTFVFDNDFPALLPAAPSAHLQSAIFHAETVSGICRVACFSPRHGLTVPRMSPAELDAVIEMWSEQYQELSSRPGIRHVQIFENRGEMMGASNPHPHCQIWASSFLPTELQKEQSATAAYRDLTGKCVLCEYLKAEHADGERTIFEDDHFLAVVPFWAVWPFEILLISKKHTASMAHFDAPERQSLAMALKDVTTRYDNLFETAFPYSMGFHQSPTGDSAANNWHFHAHYYPPLLRSATIRKFMVGYELLASPQRDITPETAAARLRDVSALHYLDRSLSA